MKNQLTANQFRKEHCDTVEHTIQKTMVQWFDMQYPGLLLYAVPNGGKRDKATAGKLKAEGVREGIPDLKLAVTTDLYSGLYIETKTTDGRLSDEQIVAHAYLRGQHYAVTVARNLEAFQRAIADYLSGQTIIG